MNFSKGGKRKLDGILPEKHAILCVKKIKNPIFVENFRGEKSIPGGSSPPDPRKNTLVTFTLAHGRERLLVLQCVTTSDFVSLYINSTSSGSVGLFVREVQFSSNGISKEIQNNCENMRDIVSNIF